MEYNTKITIIGEGKPVALIHGMGGPKFWDIVPEKLANMYKVIIPTFPGFLPEHGRINYKDKLYVDYLESLRRHLNIDKWTLIGFSMGGRTVLNYVTKYEDKVDKIVLIDSAGIGYIGDIFKVPVIRGITSKLLYKKLENRDFEEYLLKRDFLYKDSKQCYKGEEWFHEIMKDENTRYNFCNILSKIAVPIKNWKYKLKKIKKETLIMWGEKDITTPLFLGKNLKSSIINSKIIVVKEFGHMAIVEKPDFFIGEIIRFIK